MRSRWGVSAQSLLACCDWLGVRVISYCAFGHWQVVLANFAYPLWVCVLLLVLALLPGLTCWVFAHVAGSRQFCSFFFLWFADFPGTRLNLYPCLYSPFKKDFKQLNIRVFLNVGLWVYICPMPMEALRGCWIPGSWSYRWLWAICCMKSCVHTYLLRHYSSTLFVSFFRILIFLIN